MALARRADSRVLEPCALGEDFVLEPGRKRDHALLLLVGREECNAGLRAVRVVKARHDGLCVGGVVWSFVDPLRDDDDDVMTGRPPSKGRKYRPHGQG